MNRETNSVKPAHQAAFSRMWTLPSRTSKFTPYEQRNTIMNRRTSERFLFVLLKFQMRFMM